MKKWIQNLFWSKWKVARTIWPYKEGWGTYKRNRWTGAQVIMNTGLLTKADATIAAADLNRE